MISLFPMEILRFTLSLDDQFAWMSSKMLYRELLLFNSSVLSFYSLQVVLCRISGGSFAQHFVYDPCKTLHTNPGLAVQCECLKIFSDFYYFFNGYPRASAFFNTELCFSLGWHELALPVCSRCVPAY